MSEVENTVNTELNPLEPVSGFDTETYTFEPEKVERGDYVVFSRSGKVRFAKVISSGKKHIGLDVANMKNNTKIAADTELVPITVYVTKEVYTNLQSNAV